MKINAFTILSFLFSSICALNINMDLAQPFEQGWIKRDLNSEPQGLNELTKVTMFGYKCTGSVKSGFIRWKWALTGEWKCPGLTSIVGNSISYKSRKAALEYALVDFMSKFMQEYAKNLENLKSITNLAKSAALNGNKLAKLIL